MSTTTSQILLYNDWINTQKKGIQKQYDDAVKSAENTLAEEKAATDAAFDRAQANYGMLAEQLAQNGLSGSGFSDNLVRDAYAARQTGYSSAYDSFGEKVSSAEKVRSDNELALAAQQYQHQQDVNTSFLADYEAVTPDTSRETLENLILAVGYSKEQADRLFKKAGIATLSDSQYNALTGGSVASGGNGGIVNNELSNRFTEQFNKLSGNSDALTDEEFSALLKDVKANGTEGDKKKLLEILTSTPMPGGGENNTGYSTVWEYLSNTKGMQGILQEYNPDWFNKVDNTSGSLYSLTGSGGYTIESLDSLSEGENFKVKNGGESYKVQLGTKIDTATNTAIAAAANGLPDGSLFYYNGGIYVKKNNEIWSVERRRLGWLGQSSSYDEFADSVKAKAGGDSVAGEVTYTVEDADFSKQGDNFLLRDSMGRKYKVENGGEVSDTAIKAAAKSQPDNGVFSYGDGAYIRVGKGDDFKVYKIDKRALGGHYYKQLLGNISSYTTSEQSNAATNEQNKVYTGIRPVTAEVSGAANLGMFNNFTVSLNGESYGVQAGDKADDSVIKAASDAGVANKSLFTYNGDLYIKFKDTAYKVEARPYSKSGNYASLINALPESHGVSYSAVWQAGEKGDDDMEKGDDVSYIDADGKEHKVESAGVATDVTPPANIGDHVPFTKNGKVYVKIGEKVYEIKKRNLFRTNSYDSLLEKLQSSR